MTTHPVLVFRRESNGVFCDLERLVASRLLLEANSGAGKSWMLRYILEQTHGLIQQIVLDPEGEFSTLREKFDYLLAGKDGDVPAEPKTAKVLARRIVELGASAVIDLYDLKPPERKLFVKNFLDELMHLPRTLWRPLLVVIDEAHTFAPERGHGEAESLDSVISLCTQGRKRGFSALLATQRLSKLHKDAAAELQNKLIGRTTLDVDVKRAGDALGFDKDAKQGLLELDDGHFYAHGPAISKKVIQVRSGAVKTTHPKPGVIAPPAPPPPAAVRKLVAQLQDLAAQAKQEAVTLEEKDTRIRELEKQLRAKPVPAGNTPAVIDDKVIARAVAAAEKPLREMIRDLERQRDNAVGQFDRTIKKYNDDLKKYFANVQRASHSAHLASLATPSLLVLDTSRPASTSPIVDDVPKAISTVKTGPPRSAPAQRVIAPASPNGTRASLGKTPRKMLDAMATLYDLGVTTCTRSTVAGWCGISADTGTFRNYLSDLRNAAVITDEANGDVALTELGLAESERLDIPDRDALHEIWFRKLGKTPAAMLKVLIEAYPDPVTREELGAAVNNDHTTGTFRNYLSDLRAPGLMRDVSKTEVAATELLFPEGLN